MVDHLIERNIYLSLEWSIFVPFPVAVYLYSFRPWYLHLSHGRHQKLINEFKNISTMLLSHLNFDRPANVDITFRYSTILMNINNLTKRTEIPLSNALPCTLS